MQRSLGVTTGDSIAIENSRSVPWRTSGGFPEPEDDPTTNVQEIADFLEMWSCIEEGFAALDASNQESIREDNELVPAVFQGFDGVYEGEYLATARFMIEHLERFAKFVGRHLESYHPMIEGYRRLLKAFRPIRERMDGNRTLTVGELRAVLYCGDMYWPVS